MPLRAVIIGAGLGGLCLAQGLRRAGLEGAVYERDAALASRHQGYRIHVGSRGARRAAGARRGARLRGTAGRLRFAAVRAALAVLREGGGVLARLPSALARLRRRP